MFSKRLCSLLLLFGTVLSACTLKLNEDPPQAPTVAVNPVQEGCLSTAGDTMQRYFDGKLSENELNVFWNCLAKSFELFMENTKGANLEFYTPDELGHFLQKYFLKGRKIPAPLMEQLMIFKQAIIGGRTDQVTRAELRNTIVLIKAFQTETVRLRPFLPLGVKFLSKDTNDDHFEAAIAMLHSATTNLGEALANSIGEYSFDNFERLLTELDSFLYDEDTTDDWLKDALHYLSLLRNLKSTLIAPPADKISVSDWKRIFVQAPRIYTVYLRGAYYFAQPFDYTYGSGHLHVDRLFDDSYDVVERAINNHNGSVVTFEDVNTLIDSLSELDLLPVSGKTLKPLLQKFATRFLRDDSSEDANPSIGINQQTLRRARDVFRSWSEGQYFLEGMFREIAGGPDALMKSMHKYDFFPISPERGLKWTKMKDDIALQSVSENLKNVYDIQTIFPGNEDTVLVPERAPLELYSFQHLSKLNLLRLVTKMVIHGYAADPKRSEEASGLTRTELNTFYFDILPAIVELGLLNPDSETFASQRFFEAGLFLPSSNGDDYLEMNEAVELETQLWSTVKKAPVIMNRIAVLCESGARDKNKNPLIEASCFREKFAEKGLEFWSQIPAFAKFFGSLGKKERLDLMLLSDGFVRADDHKRPYNASDIQALVLMPYYIENVYARFDKDRNDTIDRYEALQAFPVFQPFLSLKASAFGLTSVEDHRALFTYMLKYGNIPNESTFEKARFAWWRYVHETDFKSDRGTVMKIFGKILKL